MLTAIEEEEELWRSKQRRRQKKEEERAKMAAAAAESPSASNGLDGSPLADILDDKETSSGDDGDSPDPKPKRTPGFY